MDLAVGRRVKFAEEKRPYVVQACDSRYAVCTKPFNPRRTVLYTVIDLEENVRGTENLIFGMGAETKEQCEDMLDRLNGRPDSGDRSLLGTAYEQAPTRTEVSHRNRIPLVIEYVK